MKGVIIRLVAYIVIIVIAVVILTTIFDYARAEVTTWTANGNQF